MLNPALGGSLTEIGVLGRRHDLADVLGRRPETYHAQIGAGGGARSIHETGPEGQPGLRRLLVYDRFRRASLLEGWFDADGVLDAVEPWPASRLALGDAVFAPTVERSGAAIEVALRHRAEAPVVLDVDKRVTISDATITACYRLAGAPGTRLDGRWAVQWNLAFSAGEAPGRYLELVGRPSLGSAGRAGDVDEVVLVDEWLGLRARLTWSPGAELAWGPVETVSVSEAGFERIYQGLALLLAWPLGADSRELSAALTVVSR
jgi:alpha-amylase